MAKGVSFLRLLLLLQVVIAFASFTAEADRNLEAGGGSNSFDVMQTAQVMLNKLGNVAEKSGKIKNTVTDAAGKDNAGVPNKVEEGVEDAGKAFENTKLKVEETAKGTTESAKAKYEAAKEKASQAAGELGAKMRNIEL